MSPEVWWRKNLLSRVFPDPRSAGKGENAAQAL